MLTWTVNTLVMAVVMFLPLVNLVTSQETAETQCTQDSETQRQLAQLMEMFHKFTMDVLPKLEKLEKLEEIEKRLDRLETYAEEPKLVGFWPLSEIHGGKDLSGYGNDIQFNNVIFEKACDSCPKTVSFKGVASSYGVIPGGGVLDVQKSFTWMAWVYPESLKDGPLFNWQDNIQSQQFGSHIWILQSGLWYNDRSGNTGNLIANLISGQWNKVAVSNHYSSGAVVLYVNGATKWFDRSTAQKLRRTEGAVSIGARTRVYPADTRALHARTSCMRLYQGKADVSLVEEALDQCPQIQQ